MGSPKLLDRASNDRCLKPWGSGGVDSRYPLEAGNDRKRSGRGNRGMASVGARCEIPSYLVSMLNVLLSPGHGLNPSYQAEDVELVPPWSLVSSSNIFIFPRLSKPVFLNLQCF